MCQFEQAWAKFENSFKYTLLHRPPVDFHYVDAGIRDKECHALPRQWRAIVGAKILEAIAIGPEADGGPSRRGRR